MGLSRQQFVQRVLEIVQAKFPLESIVATEQSFALSINGHVASLENLYRIAQLQPRGLRRQAERWVVELLRAADAPDAMADFAQIKDRLLPMILPEAGAASAAAFHRPLTPGLVIAYAVDYDRTIAYVPARRFMQWGVNAEQTHDLALSNLASRSAEISAHAAQDEQGQINLMLFQTMDGYDASRLLLPSLYQRLRPYLGGPFLAAIPNRDILLCFRDDAETVEKLRPQVAADYRRMPHQITDQLLLVTLDGIALHE
jgi:Protein of unknown function (DUF1444)